ncbi:hypothetical protein [Streptomyces dysideae]|nr:hypothetical protein [Streptomyces dysideae]
MVAVRWERVTEERALVARTPSTDRWRVSKPVPLSVDGVGAQRQTFGQA